MQEEEPDEAAKYFQQLLRDHPNSEYAERARQQLEIIGAPAPQPDPNRLNAAPPARPSLTQRLFSEVTGSVQTTTSRDGVLINKEGESDLIAEVISAGGTLPVATPSPIQRRTPPARPPVVPTQAPSTTTPRDVTLQPTQPGPPRTGDDPTRPPATTPQTPASNPPQTQTPAPAPSPTPSGTTP
jgi:hypothetical protein